MTGAVRLNRTDFDMYRSVYKTVELGMNFTGCKMFLPMVIYFFTPVVKILKIGTLVRLGLLIAMVKLDFPNDA